MVRVMRNPSQERYERLKAAAVDPKKVTATAVGFKSKMVLRLKARRGRGRSGRRNRRG